jgi:hypothetical protein
MSTAPAGLIEGFYGPPWTWAARTEVARWCAERGMRDGQADDGTWRVEPGAVQHDDNAIDLLVAAALETLEGR